MSTRDSGRRSLAAAALLAILVAPVACGGDGELPRRGVAFDSFFRQETRVALEGDTADPVAAVTSLVPRPGGGFLVADGPAGRVRAFDARGRRLGARGRPGAGPGELRQPVGVAVGPGVETGAEIRSWLRGRTVVAGLAAVADSLVVVQYGRYDPSPAEDERLIPTTVDVYRLDGEKLIEGMPLDEPILAGGDRLYTLAGTPPGPWTIGVHLPRPAQVLP